MIPSVTPSCEKPTRPLCFDGRRLGKFGAPYLAAFRPGVVGGFRSKHRCKTPRFGVCY